MLSEWKAPTGSGCTKGGRAFLLITQAAFKGSGSLACPIGNPVQSLLDASSCSN